MGSFAALRTTGSPQPPLQAAVFRSHHGCSHRPAVAGQGGRRAPPPEQALAGAEGLRPEPPRPRLDELLHRRRPGRLRRVHCVLPGRSRLAAGLDRPGVDGRPGRQRRLADSGRCHGRRRALETRGGSGRAGHDRRGRPDLGAASDVRVRRRCRDPARRDGWPSDAGDRRHQPRAGRPAGDVLPGRPQLALQRPPAMPLPPAPWAHSAAG